MKKARFFIFTAKTKTEKSNCIRINYRLDN